jgi:hypothetical protein
MVIRELLSQVQATFADAGAWFMDLSCKFGLAPKCVYTDWKDLSVGQAAFVLFLSFAIVRLILDRLAIRKFLSFCAALISGIAITFGEIYLLDNFPFKIPDSLPALPTNLTLLLLGTLLPFFIASLVHRFVFTRLTHAPR